MGRRTKYSLIGPYFEISSCCATIFQSSLNLFILIIRKIQVYVLNYPCLFTSNRLPEICSKGGDDCLRTNALAARGAWRSRRLEQWLGCQRAQLYNRFNTKAKDSLETSEHVTVWRRLPKRFCSSCAKALMMGKLCCKFRRLGGQVSSCSNFRAHGIYSLCSKF